MNKIASKLLQCAMICYEYSHRSAEPLTKDGWRNRAALLMTSVEELCDVFRVTNLHASLPKRQPENLLSGLLLVVVDELEEEHDTLVRTGAFPQQQFEAKCLHKMWTRLSDIHQSAVTSEKLASATSSDA